MLCRFNSRKTEYKTPYGAVLKATRTEFYLEIESAVYPRDVKLLVRRDGEKETVLSTEYLGMKGGFSCFRAFFIPKTEGLYFYRFGFNSNFGEKFIHKGAYGEGEIDKSESPFQLTVYSEFKKTERFFGDVFYQIFPDRFASSGESKPFIPDRVLVSDKDKIPSFLPDSEGIVKNNEFYGGDFKGIEEKIPYLKELGIKTVYLNPICEAQSNHRYDTANYMSPDPYLGSEEDFKSLVDNLHRNGMKIILDGVFSHTGADSIYFNKLSKYPSIGAYQSKESPYYKWFSFSEWPKKYRSWWGIEILPEVEETEPSFIDFICSEKGVLNYWLTFGVDGFRLDVADELPDSFLKEIYSAVKKFNPEAVVIGEVWEDASNKISYSARRQFLMGEEMDSVMNYPFRNAVIALLRNNNAEYFKETVETVLENYPEYVVLNLMNFLSTHDTKRIITALAGEEENGRDRIWASNKKMTPEELRRGAELVKTAFLILYMLPGNPQIYYGDEVAMEGYGDPFNRMFWNDKNDLYNILKFVKNLGNLRRVFKESLISTKTVISIVYGGLVVIERGEGDKALALVINPTEEKKDISLYLENSKGIVLSTKEDGDIKVLEPHSGVVLKL